MDLAAWAEVYMVINLTQFKLLLALILTMAVVSIALMTVTRRRSTWTASAPGTGSPTAATEPQASPSAKATAKAKATGRRTATETQQTTTTEEWLEDEWWDYAETGAADDAAYPEEQQAASSSTAAPRTTRKKATPRREPTALVKCDLASHNVVVTQNGKSTYATCHTCGHHTTWLPDEEMPDFQRFSTTMAALLRLSGARMMRTIRARASR